MRTWLLRTGKLIAPFERGADDCGLGAGSFGAYRARVVDQLRLGPLDVIEDTALPIEGPALVLTDDVWVTRRALRGFLLAARRQSTPSRLALPASRLLELTLPLQDVPVDEQQRAAFGVAYVPAGTRADVPTLMSLPTHAWVSPPFRELPFRTPIPKHLLGVPHARFTFPLTTTIAMRIRHWVHVLRANHLMPQVTLLERAEDAVLGSLWRSLRSVRSSRSASLRALKANFVYRGRDCFIHPTATVEASVLGARVQVGAYAYVVGSVLGDDVVIEQRAHVEQSCLGNNTFVSKNSTVSACTAFGDTDVCTNGIQTCVIAERCGLSSWARPLDVQPGTSVQVLDDGVLRSVGELPCGSAFGTDVFVGAEVNIAPGRAIPRGLRLVADPDRTLRRIPALSDPGLYTVEGGDLRRLR